MGLHQLDRMEEMLVKLVDAHPGLDDNKIHKKVESIMALRTA